MFMVLKGSLVQSVVAAMKIAHLHNSYVKHAKKCLLVLHNLGTSVVMKIIKTAYSDVLAVC